MTSSNRVLLTVGGDTVDITEIPPITLGDKRAMKKAGFTWQQIRDNDPDAEAYLVRLSVRKLRPSTTDEEIDALPAKVSQDVLNHTVTRSAEVDSPLSVSSIPSVGITDGAEPS